MNYKIIDNLFGGTIWFYSKEFTSSTPLSFLQDIDSTYSKIVFTDETDVTIYPFIQRELYKKQCDICFCNPNKTGFEEAIRMKKEGIFKNIIISTNCIYSCQDPDVFLGYENWTNSFAPDALHILDASASVPLTRGDIESLILKAETIAKLIVSKEPKNELEIIILLDAWMQENLQYIKGRESEADGGLYICESILEESTVRDPLMHGYGRCEDIAFTASLILNHPILKVRCRQVGSDQICHSWNIITCDGRDYYTDFTHNISRNPHRAPGALRAISYDNMFTLLGIEEAASKYGTTNLYNHQRISHFSYDRTEIKTVVASLKERGALKTSWNTTPIIPSYFVLK